MTRVLAIGSESSGNRLVLRILQTARPALELLLCHGHGSSEAHPWTLPHHDRWPLGIPSADKVLIIRRHSCVQEYRAWRNGHAETLAEAVAERDRADKMLAAIAGDVRTIEYEMLVQNPAVQVANLGRWLGVELAVPEDIYDGNRRGLVA